MHRRLLLTELRGGGAGGGRRGRAAARAPHQPHDLRGARRRSPSRSTATTSTRWRSSRTRSRRRSPACRASSPPVEPIRKVDEMHIGLRPDDLAFYGVGRAYVGDFVQTALKGEVVSQVLEGQRRFDLVVRLEEPYRTDVANLERAAARPARRPRAGAARGPGRRAPLTGGDSGANQVKRENVPPADRDPLQRRGPRPGGVVDRHRAAVVKADVPMPEGYFVEYGGQFESQQRATRLIARAGRACRWSACSSCCCMLFPSRADRAANPQRHPDGVHRRRAGAGADGPDADGGEPGRVHLARRHRGRGTASCSSTHYFHLMRDEGEGFTEADGPARQPGAAVAGADDGADGGHRR